MIATPFEGRQAISTRNRRAGLTLIEVMIASGLVLLLALGLLSVGMKIQHMGEYSRYATEARALAKERMEEIISMGIDNLRPGGLTLFLTDTNTTTRGYPVIRQTRLIWHAGDGSVVTGSLNGVYAEVHSDVIFWSPLSDRYLTNTYSVLIEE